MMRTAGSGGTAPPTATRPARHDGRVVKTVRPGQHGSQRWLDRYGDALLCVRYREDPASGRRCVTVELVVQTWSPATRTAPAAPAIDPTRSVLVRIAPADLDARQRAKQAGARWDPAAVAWRMPYATAHRLGWGDRIIKE